MRTKYIWKLRSTLQIYEGLYIIMLQHNWMLMHLSERIQLYQKCCKINIIFFTKAFVTPTHTFSYWDNLILPFQIWPVLIYWKEEKVDKNILKVILRGQHGFNHLSICWNFDWVWQILNQKPIQITIWRWDEQDQKYLKIEIFDQTFWHFYFHNHTICQLNLKMNERCEHI